MSELRSPLRQRILVKSAQEAVGDESVDLAAYGWRRRRRATILSVIMGLMGVVAGAVLGLSMGLAVALGLAVLMFASTATTEYRVLASSPSRLVLCRSSRIRQYAIEVVDELPRSTAVHPEGGTMLATDWRIGEMSLTISKSSEAMMATIGKRHGR